MKRILFLTNYPSPYRVNFFDELGKLCDLTVLYFAKPTAYRDENWFVESKGCFQAVQLGKRKVSFRGKTVCLDVTDWLKQEWDAIVVCGYSLPTTILAIHYLRSRKIPFYMEVDGGLIRETSGIKYRFKRNLVSAASWWLGTGKHTAAYLANYGANRERIFSYPFTSLYESDILAKPLSREEKQLLRRELGLGEEKILLYVGRFTEAKGMDALLHAAPKLGKSVGIYFIGGEASEEHREFCKENNLENVHFVGFKKKEELLRYYQAADLLVLPTHSDVWGLVINEAMACGLPVITTDKCVAGMELIQNGVNGYIVPVKQQEPLVEAIAKVFAGDHEAMGAAALESIRPYSLENMAKIHMDIFERVT